MTVPEFAHDGPVSRSIKGRFDSKPQQCRVVLEPPSSAFAATLEFTLSSKEDGDRKLTVKIPLLHEVVEGDSDELPVVSSDSSDGNDEGYYARVRVNAEERFARLRVDNRVRPAFWMEADLFFVYF